jgi:BirA family biotin operon repressor/biotin-[acetyl-CoA-carboxylase] ligase
MLDEARVAEAARAAGVDVPARYVEVTGSTNADLLALAEAGAPAWSVLVAGHQEAGRGRLGRAWVEPPGSSLLVSVLLRPELEIDRLPMLSLAAGVALVEALGSAAGLTATCRWPNDVLVGERKVAGILAESADDGFKRHAVIGTGLNLTQRPDEFPADLRRPATSVAADGGRADPAAILTAYLSILRTSVDELDRRPEVLVERYRAVCSTIGREVRARTIEGDEVEGRAAGVSDRGELIVRAPSGERRVAFGEVELLGLER